MPSVLDIVKERCGKRPPKCQTPIKRRNILLADDDSAKLQVLNESQKAAHIIKLDGCLLGQGSQIKKCDWVLYFQKDSRVLLIELKSFPPKDDEAQRDYYSHIAGQFAGSADFLQINGDAYRKVYVLVCKAYPNSFFQVLEDLFSDVPNATFKWLHAKSEDDFIATRTLSELAG